MAIEHWDEDSINALYRHYQESRDGIDYRRYKPIMDAAKDMLAQEQLRIDDAELERKLDPILDAARNMYLQEEDRSEIIDWSSPTDRIKSRGLLAELKAALNAGVSRLLDSMNPARWVPIAVTAALVVAIVPVVLQDQKGNEMSDLVVSQSKVLQQHGKIVSGELSGLIESQYGFSSSSSEYAMAFNAGILFVDILSVSRHDQSQVLQRSYERLRNAMEDRVDFSAAESVPWPQRGVELGNALQRYFSSDHYSAVFVFGQWIESSYLLAKVGQRTGDMSAFKKALESADQVVTLLQQSGHYSPQLDSLVKRLQSVSKDHEVDEAALDKLTNILLAIRTAEAQR